MVLSNLKILPEDKILIIAPHPDDESIGVGGLILQYPELCEVWVLTDGGQAASSEFSYSQMCEIRKHEMVSAMVYAGVKKYKMLEINDSTLSQHTNCLENMNLSQYTKIFVTGLHDHHPDHAAAYMSVVNALRKQNIDDVEIYLYEIHNPLRETTHFLDITDLIDSKIKLMQQHRSQMKASLYIDTMKKLAAYRAVQNRRPNGFIEAYEQITVDSLMGEINIESERQIQKLSLFNFTWQRWLQLEIENKNLADFFLNRSYKKIALYGYNAFAELLYQEISGSGIDAVCVFDQDVNLQKDTALLVKKPAYRSDIDAVVVTAVYYFDEIRDVLLSMGYHTILNFKDIMETI